MRARRRGANGPWETELAFGQWLHNSRVEISGIAFFQGPDNSQGELSER